jgi:GT2 family glycosyltransferase
MDVAKFRDKDLLDVVVVNWNAADQLSQCIDSVLRHGKRLVAGITVVDNGSTDGSDSQIEGLPGVTVVRAGQNLGFGKACNVGALLGAAEYLLFLNPDAVVYADTLQNAVAFMQDPANEEVGIAGVQLANELGHVARSCARFPSALGFCAHAVGLDRWFPALSHVMAEWDHAQVRCVDHVIGAFFLVRRTVFDAAHGFDERFFVYLEDVDFSRRAHLLGWRSVYLADVQAFHAGGGTSRQIKARRLFYSLRSRLLYACKHFSPLSAASVVFVTLAVEPLSRMALAMARLSWSSMRETGAAYGHLWRWLPQWAFKGVTR